MGLVDGSGATGVYVESKVTFREGERAALLGRALSGGPTGALSRLLTADEFLGASPGSRST